VVACTWDYGDGMTMLHTFWGSARALDPGAPDEAHTMAIQTAADLRGVWEGAGIADVETGELVVETGYRDFDDLWQPFLGGPGPGLRRGARAGAPGRAARRVPRPPGLTRRRVRPHRQGLGGPRRRLTDRIGGQQRVEDRVHAPAVDLAVGAQHPVAAVSGPL